MPATGNQLVIGGKSVDIKEVPWQVALYTFREERLSFKCGGTLISTRFILTGNISNY
jgi:secreted trypsin-like serine protease